MELLRHVVVLLHIVAFAVIFGAWIAAVAGRSFRVSHVMDWGLLLALVTGVALSFKWALPPHETINYTKITIKIALLVVLGGLLGMGSANQRRTGQAAPPALFWSVGAAAFAEAAIAVLWR